MDLLWNTGLDEFKLSFRLDQVQKRINNILGIPTKRKMIGVVMSIYDPVSFNTPRTLEAKLLIQNVWWRGTLWDQKLSDEDARKWFAWVQKLEDPIDSDVPRYVFAISLIIGEIQLHVFHIPDRSRPYSFEFPKFESKLRTLTVKRRG